MSRTRWLSWPVRILGLAVLAASFTGAALLLHPHQPEALARGPSLARAPSLALRVGVAEADASPALEAEPGKVFCFGHVDVEMGVAALHPLQPGEVQETAKDGATVHAGDVLVRLDRRPAELLVRQARTDLTDAQTQLHQAHLLVPRQKIREAAQQAVLDAVAARLRSAESIVARRQELRGLAGSDKETDVARAACDEARATLRTEEKRLEELRLNDPHLDVARAEANVASRQARLDQALLALEQCDLKAPADGTVLRVLVRPGEVLGGPPRQPAVWFCPEAPRIVRAEVDQEFGYRVAPGQPAVIRDDSTAGVTWRGKVYRVSDWYTHRRSILQEPLQLNDVRTLECLLAVEPGQAPLRIGQRVLVTLEPAPGR